MPGSAAPPGWPGAPHWGGTITVVEGGPLTVSAATPCMDNPDR